MKANGTNIIKGFFVAAMMLAMTSSFAQTAGTLTFSADTYAPSSTWGNKHVLAVWLENTANPSVFIKTNSKYGHEDDHLTSWIAKSGSNLVDAVTGATLGTYGKITVSWKGTNVSGTVVPDGTYNIWIEMGWGSNKTTNHSVSSYTFTKGTAIDNRTYAATANYTNVQLNWSPLSTLAGTTENFDNVNIFPNPTTGMLSIDFKKEMPRATIMVSNMAGKTIITEKDVKIGVGSKHIDMSAYPAGMYFVNIASEDLNYNYKVLIKH